MKFVIIPFFVINSVWLRVFGFLKSKRMELPKSISVKIENCIHRRDSGFLLGIMNNEREMLSNYSDVIYFTPVKYNSENKSDGSQVLDGDYGPCQISRGSQPFFDSLFGEHRRNTKKAR